MALLSQAAGGNNGNGGITASANFNANSQPGSFIVVISHDKGASGPYIVFDNAGNSYGMGGPNVGYIQVIDDASKVVEFGCWILPPGKGGVNTINVNAQAGNMGKSNVIIMEFSGFQTAAVDQTSLVKETNDAPGTWTSNTINTSALYTDLLIGSVCIQLGTGVTFTGNSPFLPVIQEVNVLGTLTSLVSYVTDQPAGAYTYSGTGLVSTNTFASLYAFDEDVSFQGVMSVGCDVAWKFR